MKNQLSGEGREGGQRGVRHGNWVRTSSSGAGASVFCVSLPPRWLTPSAHTGCIHQGDAGMPKDHQPREVRLAVSAESPRG